ncbi:MAG: hypothetical protein ACPF8V_02015, partial [Luteibaculum sp.]
MKGYLILCIGILSSIIQTWGQCGPCQYKTTNMVVNGGFELGNIGFTSNYNYSTNLYPEANYMVGPNAKTYHGSFNGKGYGGSGNFMIINGAPIPGTKVWCQTIPVIPNTNYNFSTWISSVHPSNPALLQFSINGVQIGDIFSAPNTTNVWQEFFVNWNSGNSITATICIENQSLIAAGNDFGIDNISFAPCLPYTIIDRPLAGLDTLVCSGDTINLGIPGSPGFTTHWEPEEFFGNPNALQQSFVLVNETTAPIEFTFTLETDSAGLGCIYEEDVVITVNPKPQFTLGTDTSLCEGPLTLAPSVIPGSIFDWSNGSNEHTLTVSQSGTYGLELSLFGCTFSDEIEIQIDTQPTFSLGPDLQFCAGDSVQISAPLSGLWNNGSAETSIWVSQSSTLWFETVNGTCTHRDSIQATQNPLPSIDLGNDTTLCQGPFTLIPNAPGATSFLWSDLSIASSLSINQTDTIWLEVSDGLCSNRDSIVVQIDTIPEFELGPDVQICAGDSATISAPIPGLWSNGSNTPTQTVKSTETIWLETVNGSCLFRDSIQITQFSYPNVDLGPDTTLCNKELFELTAPSAGLWNGLISSPQISVTTDTTLFFVAQEGPCISRDSIHISFEEIAITNFPEDTTICSQSTLEVNIPLLSGEICVWQDGLVANSRTLNLPGTYIVEKYSPACSVKDSIQLDTAAQISSTIPDSIQACETAPAVVSYPLLPGESLAWNDGSNVNPRTLSNSGEYWLEISNGYCSHRDSIYYQQDSIPQDAYPPLFEVCEGDSVWVSPSNTSGDVYTWSDGFMGDSRFLNQAGNYTVEVINGTCNISESLELKIDQFPVLQLPDTVLSCHNQAVSLSSAWSGNWSNGTQGNQISVTQSGWYALEVQNNQCTARDSSYVFLASLPNPEFFTIPICTDDQRQVPFVHDYEAYAFYWEDNLSGDMQRSFTDSAGKFFYSYSDSLCVASGFVVIDVIEKPNILVPDSVLICEGSIYLLEASVPQGYELIWEDNPNGYHQRKISEAGEYRVIATNGICAATDTCTLWLENPPQLITHPVDTFCSGNGTQFQLPNYPNYQVFWAGGDTSQLSINSSTLKSYTITNGICTRENNMQSYQLQAPTWNNVPSYRFCESDSVWVQLNVASLIPSTVDWEDGVTEQNRFINTPGYHSFSVSNKYCQITDSVMVYRDTLPEFIAPDSIFFCEGNSGRVKIEPANEAYHLAWFDNDSSWQRSFNTDGAKSFRLWNQSCVVNDQSYLQSLKYPELVLPDSANFCENQVQNIQPQVKHFTQWFWLPDSTRNGTFTSSGTKVLKAFNRHCESQKEIAVLIDSIPVLPPPLDTTICENLPFTYQLQTIYPYTWKNENDNPKIGTKTPGLHYFRLKNGTCSQESFVRLKHEQLPTLNYPDSLICSTDSVSYNFPLSTYRYTINGVPQDQNTFILREDDLYVLEAQNGICQLVDSFNLYVEQFQKLDLGPDIERCSDNDLTLVVDVPTGYDFSWSNGNTNPTRTLTESATVVAVIQGEVCFSSDIMVYSVIPSPRFELNYDATLCDGDSLFIVPQNMENFQRWQWSDQSPSSLPDRYFHRAGVYTLTAFNGPCTYSEDLRVKFQENPFKTFVSQQAACEDKALIFELDQAPEYNYLFNGQIWTEDSIIITKAGSYPLLVNAN